MTLPILFIMATGCVALALFALAAKGYGPHLRFGGPLARRRLVTGLVILVASTAARLAWWDVLRFAIDLAIDGEVGRVPDWLRYSINGVFNTVTALGLLMMLGALHATIPDAERRRWSWLTAAFYPPSGRRWTPFRSRYTPPEDREP